MKTTSGKFLNLFSLAIVLTIVGIVACGKPKILSKRGYVQGADQVPVEKKPETSEEVVFETKKTLNIVRTIDSSSMGIQAKSFQVLKSSIKSCFSSSTATLIRADMIITAGTSPALANGRVRFLLAQPGIIAGIDILDYEKANLGGDDSIARTTIASDALSATYLRALATVGDVIAHSCELDDPFCSCSEEGEAAAMLARCLPQLNPTLPEFRAAAKAMAQECSAGPASQRRAIAALVSSYPFAQGR